LLRFFRINDPYRLIFILIILILVRFVHSYFITGTPYLELKWLILGEWLGDGFIMYKQTYDYTGPLSAMVYKGLDYVFGRNPLVYWTLSTLLITVQAGVFNSLLLKNKVYNENSYLPAFLYAVLSASVIDFMTLSPQLMSLTFILLALRNIIRRIDNQATDELFLSSGIFVGIASMIYLPATIFLFVFLFSLILFSSAIPRRLLLYVFGFLLVFSACATYFYLNDSLFLFLDRAVFNGMLQQPRIFFKKLELLTFAAPLALILLFSVIKKTGQIRLTNFQQKVEQVIWLIFVGGIVTIFLSNESAGMEFLFLVPLVAYFWTHYFILLRRRFFKLVMPYLLIFGMLAWPIYFYKNLAEPMLISEVQTKKKMMVIGEKLEYYQDQEMATPFFHHAISSDLFSELDTYEGSENFYVLFNKVSPDVILDELGAVPKLMHRFPEIEKNYKRVASNTYEKISN